MPHLHRLDSGFRFQVSAFSVALSLILLLAPQAVRADATLAKIEGDRVIVSAPSVTNPVAVRYAWVDFPICNLKNTAGLPVAPFRSDDWPRESQLGSVK